jgi:hypothetical protein
MDDSSAAISCLVNHMYAGDLFQIDLDNLLHCSRMAHKYDVPQLQRAVDAFAKQLTFRVREANVIQVIAVAHDGPGLQELKECCIEYLAKRLQRVCNLR